MIQNRFRRAPRALGALATVLCLASVAPSVSAQTVDYTVSRIDVIQAIPGVINIARKSTVVRSHLAFTGTPPAGEKVDGVMRVFIGGVEQAYSPIFSENGPIDVPGSVAQINENDTLNFTFLPPVTGNMTVTVEVNPAGPGQVPETNFANNTLSRGGLAFECRVRPDLVYVPIDYRPGGGGNPSIPNPDKIEPGVGDNFVSAVFPVPDWTYRKNPAGAKLWTGSLTNPSNALLNSLLADLNMMVPQPDFIYGWVPGPLPGYNGVAIGIPGKAAYGNTELIRHQRTFAHELGHLNGGFHINNTINVVGFDVEHHLAITEGLPRTKASNLFDIMVAGLLTDQAWIYDVNWGNFAARSTYACSGDRQPGPNAGDSLMLGGIWEMAAHTFEVTHSVVLPSGTPSETTSLAESDLVVRTYSQGALVGEFPYGVEISSENCAGDATQAPITEAGFVVVLPSTVQPSSIDRLVVVETATGNVLHESRRSASAPSVSLVEPRSSVVSGEEIRVQWSAVDADGDALQHYLVYSPDGVQRVPLQSAESATSFNVNMDGLPELQPGKGYFEILTSDGLNTTRVRTGDLTSLAQQRGFLVNPPDVHIKTPDDGQTYAFGNNMILHSSGWDLEDGLLAGNSIRWSSDIDGPLIAGRLVTFSGLSVGTHVLTVTATDSSGLQSTDTATVTITPRALPHAADATPRFAPGNFESYLSTNPVIGQNWTATVNLTGSGHASAQVLAQTFEAHTTLPGGQVVLIGGPKVFSLPLRAGPIASWTSLLPNDPALAGIRLATQAVHLGGVVPFGLSNSQDLYVGF